MLAKRSSSEWFQEAARCYIEHHQGCPWCGGSHRVYYIRRERQTIYYCQGCDFRVEHNESAGTYLTIPGENKAPAKSTMRFEQGIAET